MGLDAAYGGNLQLSPEAEFCTTVLKRSTKPANSEKLLSADISAVAELPRIPLIGAFHFVPHYHDHF
jgi:hypothetical protein